MIATVSPSVIHGEVLAPASKSAMQRACALALMHNGKTTIINPGVSNDDFAAEDIIRRCGASCVRQKDELQVQSHGVIQPAEIIHCGESGLSVRMFTPIVALGTSAALMSGEGSLLTRPMNIFEEVLPQLNVSVKSTNGYLPMEVQGPLIARDCFIDGSKSSQYVTGILFALAKSAKERVVLNVSNLTSRPYVDLSLHMLQHFGYQVENKDYEQFIIHPVEIEKKDITYRTEGDWSGAAFLLVAATLAGEQVLIKGLDINSKQADKAIMEVLTLCGASVETLKDGFMVRQKSDLKAFEFDATHCPDLFPPLVALAIFCKGESIIRGTSRLLTKESDRLQALTNVFEKMGVTIRTEADCMWVSGGEEVHGAEVDGHHDHRIVMACAVAGLRASGDVSISGAEAINKSYPEFFNHLTLLGASVSLS